MDGYPTFVVSILMIGANTALIGDIAGHLGCFIFLKDSVNAIAFVALGTSVPGETRARAHETKIFNAWKFFEFQNDAWQNVNVAVTVSGAS